MSKSGGRKNASHAKLPAGEKKNPSGKAAPGKSNANPGIALAIPFLVIAVVRAVAGIFPVERLWGLNHVAYLPETWAMILAVTGVLLALPAVYGIVESAGEYLFRSTSSGIRAWIFAGAAAVLFWVFRIETYFLGDGAVYLAEMYRYIGGHEYVPDVLFSTYSAPLTGRLLAWSALLLESLTRGGSGVLTYLQMPFWLWGLLSGAAYIYIVARASSTLFTTPVLRFSAVLMLTGVPGTLFFFGYVEYYTFVYVGIALYTVLLIPSAEGRLSVLWPGLALLFSVASHILAAVAIPSYVMLLVHRHGTAGLRGLLRPRSVMLATATVLLVFLVYYFASGIYVEGSRTILAMYPFGEEGAVQQYTLLSSWHLLDVLNMMFLAGAPVAPLLLLLRKEHAGDAGVLMLGVNLVFFSTLLFFGYTCFGMARDWDVNAMWGLAFTVFLLAVLRKEEAGARARWLGGLAAAASLAALLPWLAVNLNNSSSETRFRAVMALDDRHVTGDFALNGYEHLRKYYQSTGDREGLQWAMQKKIEMVGYPLDFQKLYTDALTTLDMERRVAAFDWMMDELHHRVQAIAASGEDRSYAGTLGEYVELYAELVLERHYLSGDDAQARGEVDRRLAAIEDLAPSHPVVRLLRAKVEAERGGPAVPADLFVQAADAWQLSSTFALGISTGLVMNGQPERAADLLEQAKEIDPTLSVLSLYQAEAQLMSVPPRYAEAYDNLTHFLANTDKARMADAKILEQLVGRARQLLPMVEAQRAVPGGE